MDKEKEYCSYLSSLLKDIDMPADMAQSILGEYRVPGSGTFPGTAILTNHLTAVVRNRLNGCWKRFPEDIFIDTIKVFSRFVREHHRSYGYYGFDRDFWTTRQVHARLFRLGELEYELLEEDGCRRISLHIPSDVRLESSLLNESVSLSHFFLDRYFPEWAQCDYFCESWLLSGDLKQLLPQQSRILMFQQAFDIREQSEASKDYLEWVFHVAVGQTEKTQPAGAERRNLPSETSQGLCLQGRCVS